MQLKISEICLWRFSHLYTVIFLLYPYLVYSQSEDNLTRFKLDWPMTLCSRSGAVALNLDPLSLIRAFTNAKTTAIKEPSQALMQLGEALHLTWKEFPRTHPILFYVIGRLAKLTLHDTAELLRRLNTILFLHAIVPESAIEARVPSTSWANTGIASYIQSQLFFDPAYRKAMLEFLHKLERVDQAFLAAEREYVKKSVYKDITFEIGMGPRNRDFRTLNTNFDIVGEMIKSAMNALPSDRFNTDDLGLLIHKMLLFFHDDTQHFPRVNVRDRDDLVNKAGILDDEAFKEFSEIMQLTPNVVSLIYTDWSKSNPLSELDALQFLYDKAARYQIHFLDLMSIRWGNYHITASAGLHGLLSHGLYSNLPGKNWAITLLQRKLAIAYRALTQDSYQAHQWEKLIDNDMMLRQPTLYEAYQKGKLTLKQVMGRRSGNEFNGGYFNDLFQNEQALQEIARNNHLNPYDSNVISGLREAVLYRQIRFLQLIRTVSQHTAGGSLSKYVRERVRESL